MMKLTDRLKMKNRKLTLKWGGRGTNQSVSIRLVIGKGRIQCQVEGEEMNHSSGTDFVKKC